MKNNLKDMLVLLVSLLVFFTSCDKNAGTSPEPVKSELLKGTVSFDTTGWANWVYYSFDKESVVEIDDFVNSMEWDIGFHYYDVRVNCGTAGPGLGGTYNAGKVEYASVTEAPETGYSLNDSINIIVDFSGFPPPHITVPGDTILDTWMTFTGPPPTFTLNDNIYVIKTAQGKYVKIWLKDFFDDKGESGYVKMQYSYQKEGTRVLE